MAYVADELDADAARLAMGLYIARTALGGMAGRLGCGALAELGHRLIMAHPDAG